MGIDLDRVIERVRRLDAETRNALVHIAAERLSTEGILTLIRSHSEKGGAIFDLYRNRRTGKTYITRRPNLAPEKRASLKERLSQILRTVE